MVGVSAGRFGWVVEAVGLLVSQVEVGNDLAVEQYGLRLGEHTLPSCAASYVDGTRPWLLQLLTPLQNLLHRGLRPT